ncbi:unnamed protein product [Linum trigynum]|uniref:Uncharacterized protein n=1 Tax=Linum trigynum TaxID=586398 RepID=A0AAV2GPE5_9ROSI
MDVYEEFIPRVTKLVTSAFIRVFVRLPGFRRAHVVYSSGIITICGKRPLEGEHRWMHFETKIKIRSDFDTEKFDVWLRYSLLTVEIPRSKSSSAAAESTQLAEPVVILLQLTVASGEENSVAEGMEETAAAKEKGSSRLEEGAEDKAASELPPLEEMARDCGVNTTGESIGSVQAPLASVYTHDRVATTIVSLVGIIGGSKTDQRTTTSNLAATVHQPPVNPKKEPMTQLNDQLPHPTIDWNSSHAGENTSSFRYWKTCSGIGHGESARKGSSLNWRYRRRWERFKKSRAGIALYHVASMVRATDKKKQREALDLVLQLLKYNDNDGNPCPNVFWRDALVLKRVVVKLKNKEDSLGLLCLRPRQKLPIRSQLAKSIRVEDPMLTRDARYGGRHGATWMEKMEASDGELPQASPEKKKAGRPIRELEMVVTKSMKLLVSKNRYFLWIQGAKAWGSSGASVEACGWRLWHGGVVDIYPLLLMMEARRMAGPLIIEEVAIRVDKFPLMAEPPEKLVWGGAAECQKERATYWSWEFQEKSPKWHSERRNVELCAAVCGKKAIYQLNKMEFTSARDDSGSGTGKASYNQNFTGYELRVRIFGVESKLLGSSVPIEGSAETGVIVAASKEFLDYSNVLVVAEFCSGSQDKLLLGFYDSVPLYAIDVKRVPRADQNTLANQKLKESLCGPIGVPIDIIGADGRWRTVVDGVGLCGKYLEWGKRMFTKAGKWKFGLLCISHRMMCTGKFVRVLERKWKRRKSKWMTTRKMEKWGQSVNLEDKVVFKEEEMIETYGFYNYYYYYEDFSC